MYFSFCEEKYQKKRYKRERKILMISNFSCLIVVNN